MFVIADIEWITNTEGYRSPTQLAAVRVNECWDTIEEFHSFICPPGEDFHIWDHVAYVGGSIADFLGAKNGKDVFSDFQAWLCEEDVLLWWYRKSETVFQEITNLFLKIEESHKAVSVNEYVYEFLAGQPASQGNSYRVAKARGVETHKKHKHFARNDVRVIRELMQKIAYPQHRLLEPLEKTEHPQAGIRYDIYPYWYDPRTKRIHSSDCERIIGIETQGFATLKNPIRKGFLPCECCKPAYAAAIRERNADTINRLECAYIYAPDSPVFHKRTCSRVLSAKSIAGTRYYKTAVLTGRKPCKICHPTPKDIAKSLPPQRSAKPVKKEPGNILLKEAARAVKRQKFASDERKRKLQQDNLTETERKDIFTLTQPRFAFWVGQGYQSFHLYSCSKLNKVSNLTGFSTYQEAIDAGHTPCRKCKPTTKHDVKYSIPITSQIRKNEKVEDLEALCTWAGYPHHRGNSYFCMETPVGKWRIHITSAPVKLEHINLVKTPGSDTYHEQPRLFLSFLDTFDYIRRHDETLMQSINQDASHSNSTTAEIV